MFCSTQVRLSAGGIPQLVGQVERISTREKHVPAFWYWKGRLGEGIDVNSLTAHLDLYRTFCELAGAEIPESKLPPGGRSA